MGSSEGRQEAIGIRPDGLTSSYAPAAPTLDQLSDCTIAGNSRRTVSEPDSCPEDNLYYSTNVQN